MVGGIGFFAGVARPWNTASTMACLLIAMSRALRTSVLSKGACVVLKAR